MFTHVKCSVWYYYYSPEGLRANHGFTLWAKRTAFMRSAKTPPKLNQFGWNLEYCEPNDGGWPWQILGAMRLVGTVWEGAEIFFCRANNARFQRFPVGKILRHFNTTTRRSVGRWKRSEQNFENFTIRGRFSKENAKNAEKFLGFATLGRHNSAMITNAENSRLNGPPTVCLVSIFKVRINWKPFPSVVRCVQENIFGKD